MPGRANSRSGAQEAREPGEFTGTRRISEPKREVEVILGEFGLALKANGQPLKGLL